MHHISIAETFILTPTSDTSIFGVITVVKPYSIAYTVNQPSLSAAAHKIVQNNCSCSLTKVGVKTSN